jgi:membrane-associated phospholipid phosphatase
MTPSTAGRTCPAQSEPTSAGRRTAAVFSEIFAPVPQILTQSILVTVHAADGLAAVAWLLTAAMFGSVLPMLILLTGVRKGSFANHHIPERERRILPMAAVLVSILIGLGIMLVAHAPDALSAVFAALAIELVVLIAITRYWQISVHTAVACSMVIAAVATYGPALTLLVPVIPATMWGRVRVGAHTLLQTVAGVLVGGSVFGPVFLLLT